ncbi:MAG TPA: glycosyltransferase [Gemmatimonadales bacterium]
MKIALMYHARLPVKGYGGTERVVVWLGRGLAELGHEVTLLAAPGSKVPWARHVAINARRAARPDFDVRPHLPAGLDLVHAHQEIADPGIPWVWTLHGNSRTPRTFSPNVIGLSADHARRQGLSRWVYNGLDPAEFEFRRTKGDYDLFLGRLHSVKGWQWAVEGARQSQRRLLVAGGWRPVVSRWVRFVGSVDGRGKVEALAGARLLWSPVQWDEPFGLTSIEALASGTPVLGTRRGALPEIVTPDVGALGDTLDQLLALIPTVLRCDPEVCRARVEQVFHYRVMAEAYLDVYRSVGRSVGP